MKRILASVLLNRREYLVAYQVNIASLFISLDHFGVKYHVQMIERRMAGHHMHML